MHVQRMLWKFILLCPIVALGTSYYVHALGGTVQGRSQEFHKGVSSLC